MNNDSGLSDLFEDTPFDETLFVDTLMFKTTIMLGMLLDITLLLPALVAEAADAIRHSTLEEVLFAIHDSGILRVFKDTFTPTDTHAIWKMLFC